MSKNISNLHPELLDKRRKELLQKLVPFVSEFVLGGGTALALQLAHRKSFDFDFFSSSPIPKTLLERLSKIFIIENVVVDTPDELTLFTNKIKITFLYYPFKPIFKYFEIVEGLAIFSIKGIALQKAYTIGRRGEYRDYYDLYTILKHEHTSLRNIVHGAKRIYNGAFDERLFLEQLVYYGDLRNFEIIPVSGNSLPTPDEIKHYFEKLVRMRINTN
ncbi:nucleotidyl transferase AbiEii/AbiGii toxin family protein [Candidatus Microgenomates bacterium]|nr:nucleotidyl transferase AbiEii/AbiGii toxin family protein [Candidatus Microgenomates bacterium]